MIENVRYTDQFILDVSQVVRYISHVLDNTNAAQRLITSIEKAIENRTSNPEGFEPVHTCKVRQYLYYRIYIKHFTLYYIVIDGTMELRRFIGSSRDYSKLL
jgi:plasmid stabilization system protein ParE